MLREELKEKASMNQSCHKGSEKNERACVVIIGLGIEQEEHLRVCEIEKEAERLRRSDIGRGQYSISCFEMPLV